MKKIFRLRRLLFNFMFLGLGIMVGQFNNPLVLSLIGCGAFTLVIIYDFQMEARIYDENARRDC